MSPVADAPASPPQASAPGVATAPLFPSAGEPQGSPLAPAPVSAATPDLRSGSGEELAARADTIVVETISSVLAEKMLGPYGENGTQLPADQGGGLPFTDYVVQGETVLKADVVVTFPFEMAPAQFMVEIRGEVSWQ